MTINQIQQEIIEEFGELDEWMDKYTMLIEMGNDLAPMPESEKTPENLIEGCQSRVWITATAEEDTTMHFHAASDAVIVKGIIAMLLRVFEGQRAEDIAKADLYFIDKIGLQEHLSPTRSNGLSSMVTRIRLMAAEIVSNHQA